MTPDISVILAVYGAEPWIEAALRSVMAQTLNPQRIELVLVDDCSPDRSMEIARRVLAGRLNVVCVSHERNLGVSRSRQDGVNAASGRYIIHLDPDDLLPADAYEQLLAEAERAGADVAMGPMTIRNAKGDHLLPQQPAELTARCVMEQVCGRRLPSLHGSLCNKLIATRLYRQIEFPAGINFCEDAVTLCRMLCLPGVKVAAIRRPVYIYREHSGSLVRTPSPEGDLRLYALLEQLAREAAKPWQARAWRAFVGSLLFLRNYMTWRGSGASFRQYFAPLEPDVALTTLPGRLQGAMLRRALRSGPLPPYYLRRLIYRLVNL